MAHGTPEAADGNWQAKHATAWVVVEAKTWALEESGQAMEEDYWLVSKKWQTFWHFGRGKQCSTGSVYSASGELLTLTQDVVGWCKEYFWDDTSPL